MRIGLFCTVLFVKGMLVAQEPKSASAEKAFQYLTNRGEVIFRFLKPTNVSLAEITKEISIDDFRHDTVTAYANDAGFRRFLLLNIPYEIVQPPTLQTGAFTPHREAGDDWRSRYPSYPEYLALMAGFATDYSGLCQLRDFGTSVDGRKLLALKISDNPGSHEAEPVVLYAATMHGDETLGYMLMLRLIDYLLINYYTDPQVKRLVDNVEIWINPLSNPDGTYFLSDNSVTGATRYNSNNEDLNRDFPQIDDPDWENRERQPETKAMMNFMHDLQLVLAANFHGGAEVVNYPWDTWSRLHADDNWYRHISRVYADTVHLYSPAGYLTYLDNGITNGYSWYQVSGGRQDYANFFLHAREVTIELSNQKMPPESELEVYWQYNKQSLLQYIGQALSGVRGVVSDSETGQPIEAKISVEDHDIDSSFVISPATNGIYYRLIGGGNYIFRFTSPGYMAKSLPVYVQAGALLQLDVELVPIVKTGLYPNPFSHFLTTYVSGSGNNLILEFTDVSGRSVKRITQAVLVPGKQEIEVNGLAPGVYIVNITYDNQTLRQVVVRTRSSGY